MLDYIIDNMDEIFRDTAAGAGLLLFLLLYLLWGRYSHVLRRLRAWEKTMTGTERSLHLDQLISDKITDLLEELLHDGFITREERDKYYKRIGEGACLLDLLPRKLRKEKLSKIEQNKKKAEIKARIENVDEKLKQLPSRQFSIRGIKERMLKQVA